VNVTTQMFTIMLLEWYMYNVCIT